MCHIRKSREIWTVKYKDDLKTAPITLNLIPFCPLKILQNVIKYVSIAFKKRVESNDFWQKPLILTSWQSRLLNNLWSLQRPLKGCSFKSDLFRNFNNSEEFKSWKLCLFFYSHQFTLSVFNIKPKIAYHFDIFSWEEFFRNRGQRNDLQIVVHRIWWS